MNYKKLTWFIGLMVLMIMGFTHRIMASESINVYVDVEGYNLGQGFYIKPTKLTLPVGSTAEVATRELFRQTGTAFDASGIGSQFYLSRIYGINNGVVNLPSYINEEIDTDSPSGSLGEFDYTSTSGWMITVNHFKINVGAGAWTLKDNDVIRWQFTLEGLGADLGLGGDALYQHADKTELIRLLETIKDVQLKERAYQAVINPLTSSSHVQELISLIKQGVIENTSKNENSNSGQETHPSNPTGTEQGTNPSSPTGTEQGTNPSSPTGTEQEINPSSPTGTEQGTHPSNPTGTEQGTNPSSPTGTEQEINPSSPTGTEQEINPSSPTGTEQGINPSSPTGTEQEINPDSSNGTGQETKPSNPTGTHQSIDKPEDMFKSESVEKLKASLNELLEYVKQYQEELYTTESWKELTDLIQESKVISSKALVSDQEILSAIRKLYHAISVLRLKNITNVDIAKPLDNVLKFIHTNVSKASEIGVGTEWEILTLARGNIADNKLYERYYHNVLAHIEENLDVQSGKIKRVSSNSIDKRSTEMSRMILALTALGVQVNDVRGMDLFKGFKDVKYLNWQGINGTIFALIAANSSSYSQEYLVDTRQQLLDEILRKQLADGGWSLSGKVSDPDITAMALQALAPYYRKNDARVLDAVNRGVIALSNMMLSTGGFQSGASHGLENTPSTAQVVTALSELGIDVASDVRFNRYGNNPLAAMLKYQSQDGSFFYTIHHIGVAEPFSTQQAGYALVAYYRLVSGKTGLYDMSDTKTWQLSEPISPIMVQYEDNKDKQSDKDKGSRSNPPASHPVIRKYTVQRVQTVYAPSKVVLKQHIVSVPQMSQVSEKTPQESKDKSLENKQNGVSLPAITQKNENSTTSTTYDLLYMWLLGTGIFGVICVVILKKKNVW
ncbi:MULTISPECIES: DUF4430 domain-containing protein [unclassified Granulicatella]|uniref:DUF4430 domain-containing protein n=1 Tax=unclassified Granulicatella TaxID=2630493 RepID=UPI0010748BB8|nr:MULTISPECIES: DUF4430 domain-containing protein [unclassified Granulicatella]MBF0780911.1 DUF4430 domain-containing protein [Granulicatella sp. 19428wC4_WM01]TFU93226.1 DUF4430 domain-containing protein [Granulicatella sp. WM01]